jgi:hypothetical protein
MRQNVWRVAYVLIKKNGLRLEEGEETTPCVKTAML